MTIYGIPIEWFVGAALIAACGALVWLAVRAYQRHSRRKALLLRLKAISYDVVHQVLVPDGMGGYIHIDHILLTPRGLLVLDTRRVPGLIFGGDQMSEWTVMGRGGRFTFDNPQPALYDRVAVVKALAGDAPVEGRLIFSSVGRFTKGKPKWVLMLDALEVEFPPVDQSRVNSPELQPLKAAWERVKANVTSSPHLFTSL